MSETTTAHMAQALQSLSPSEQVRFITSWFHSKFGEPDFDDTETTPFGTHVSVWSASSEEEEDLRKTFESSVTPEVFEECLNTLVYETSMWSPEEESAEQPQDEISAVLADLYNSWQLANPSVKVQSLKQRLVSILEQLGKLAGYNGGPVLGAASDDPPLKAGVLRAVQISASRLLATLESKNNSDKDNDKFLLLAEAVVKRLGGWLWRNLRADIDRLRASYTQELGKVAAQATGLLFIDLFCKMFHVIN